MRRKIRPDKPGPDSTEFRQPRHGHKEAPQGRAFWSLAYCGVWQALGREMRQAPTLLAGVLQNLGLMQQKAAEVEESRKSALVGLKGIRAPALNKMVLAFRNAL